MKAGEWEFRDAINSWTVQVDTFLLPGAFLVVWCDGLDNTATQIHTNFNLGGSGDELHIFYLPSGAAAIEVDGYVFGAQSDGTSFGRSPNGSSTWVTFSNPTIGASNP
jgi:hypothetical protein